MQITKIKKMFQNMIFLRIIGLLVKEISEKKFSVKKISGSGGGGTYRQKIKIKKMFQNMIFWPITRLLVKEISERKILAKNFSKSWKKEGYLHATNQN